jgi:16S rRNA (guanine1207-N2)-methyltransferase
MMDGSRCLAPGVAVTCACLRRGQRRHDRCFRRASTRFLPRHPKVETVKHESENGTVTTLDVEGLLGGLSRLPDVEADNLQAFDATDRLLLETAADVVGPDTKLVILGDRYGALTLGALAGLGVGHVRVNQDLFTGRLALRRNAVSAGLEGRFTEHELDRELLDDADRGAFAVTKVAG